MTKEKSKRNRRIFALLAGMGLLLFAVFAYRSNLKAVNLDDRIPIYVEIPIGSNLKDISNILFDKDLIRNKNVFKIEAKRKKLASNLKAGSYEMKRSMDLNEILNILIEGGPSSDISSITIPEGYELEDIAEKLGNNGKISEEKFLELASDKSNFEDHFDFLKELDYGHSLEGFLFPATYEIDDNTTEEDIIIKMLGAFDNIYKEDILPNIDGSDLDLNKIITLASIIEREARVDSERSVMSGVFYNRIKKGMPLQSCATVQYVIGERKPVLSEEETRVDSPFNTYINEGLPPGPIASPGRESIMAALFPEDVDYLFFVLTGEDGSHTFTKTYEEHLEAQKNMIGR